MLFIHLTPTGNNVDGKVADLQLSYRLPGSSEIITQKITLAYPHDPAELRSETYLSAPEMAERFAMYNVFLGLRFATRSTDLGCAMVALNRTKEEALRWNTTHEDPDITADVALIDMYLANIAAHGGTNIEDSLAQCGADGIYDDEDYGYDGGHDHHHGCAVGGNPGSLVVIALVAAVTVRRRRRR